MFQTRRRRDAGLCRSREEGRGNLTGHSDDAFGATCPPPVDRSTSFLPLHAAQLPQVYVLLHDECAHEQGVGVTGLQVKVR